MTILGSGTGTPSLERNAAGLFIKIGSESLLFDTGPGTVKRLLEIGITYHDLDYIFYTHFHTDHTMDLATFLFAARYSLSLRTKSLTIIGPSGLEKFYYNLLNLYGDVIRPESYVVNLKEIEEQAILFNGFSIKVLRMLHTPESVGYRVESAGKAVVYSGDTDVCENIIKLGQNAEVLILDCSFPDEMKVKGHLVPSEAGQIATACGCQKLILSHLYPVCQKDELIKQARKAFKGEIVVASDLMTIAV